MKFFSAAGMQSVDRDTIEAGTAGEVLMARACRALAAELDFFNDHQPRPVVVCCGPGNNGGDGFGLAWHLLRLNWPVEIWCAVPADKIQGDAALFFERARRAGVPVREMATEQDWEHAETRLSPSTLLVDALLGTGSREAPRGVLAAAVRFLRQQQLFGQIWAVDIPSGLNPDCGEPFDPDHCVRADHTLTLGGPKAGFLNDVSVNWTGSISVLDLGFSEDVLNRHAFGTAVQSLSDAEVRELLPRVAADAHKSRRGHLLLVGGSPGMSGAISLSARAALRSGCGLVTVLTAAQCAAVVDTSVPEAMVIYGRQGKFGTLTAQTMDFSGFDAVAAGPGLRVNIDTSVLLQRLLHECRLPLVLDADALNLFAELDPEERESQAPLWFTPHPGEMARLMKSPVARTQADREAAVREAANRLGGEVLLKGARSRMQGADEAVWLNLNGNPGMATGGSGDVLTGLLGSLLAQGVAPERCLPLAVYLHGRAGDLAAQRKGQAGMTAGDLVEALPAVLKL